MPKTKSPSQQGKDLAARFRENHMMGTGPNDDINSLMTLVESDFIILELPQNLDALTLRDPASGAVTVGSERAVIHFANGSPWRTRLGTLWPVTSRKTGRPVLRYNSSLRNAREYVRSMRTVPCGCTPRRSPRFTPGRAPVIRGPALPGLPENGSNPTLRCRTHFGGD